MCEYRDYLVAIKRLRNISNRVRNATGDHDVTMSNMTISERRRSQTCLDILFSTLRAGEICPRITAVSMIYVDRLGYEMDYEGHQRTSHWSSYFAALQVSLDMKNLGEYLEGFDNLLDASPKMMKSQLTLFKLGLV
jgi:hypothetical protein